MQPQSDARPGRGILLMILAVSVLAVMSACVKAADRIPAGQAVFFRASLSLPLVLAWLALRGEFPRGLRTRSWRSHAVRGIVGSASMGLGFAGLRYLPLPEVTALTFVTPILVVLFAAVMLGERIRLIRISAVVAGLAGVLVILWPRLTLGSGAADETALFGASLVLAAAGLAALAQVFVKSMAGREHTAAIVFYFLLTATLLSLLTIPFGWVWPTPRELALLVGAGLIGGLGQILLTSSFRYAEAGVLAPFTYISMIWSLVIGYVVFAEVPTVQMLAGATMVIAAGVAIWYRERQLGLRRAAEGKVGAKGLQ
jgi:drug/metabolite transporter (DMT)-like permease